jgi:hypoxanthine phosphoribosyltransferase
MQITVRTPQELFEDTLELAKQVIASKKKYDAIVGISPGGSIISRTLGDILNCPVQFQFEMLGQESEALEETESPVTLNLSPNQIKFLKNKKILLVDDVVDSGDKMIVAVELLQKHCSTEIDTLALYCRSYAKLEVTFHLKEIERWIIMPYEYATIMRYFLREQQVPLDKLKEMFPKEIFEKMKTFVDQK